MMTDPFPGVKRRRQSYRDQQGRGWAGKDSAVRGRNGRVARTHQATLHMDLEVFRWLSDRADLLGTSFMGLTRDILVAWMNGVIAAEDEAGIRLDEHRPSFDVENRGPGYVDAIFPRGNATSHLDSSPLGLGEL